MTVPAGMRLGPYEILAPLGVGGMGEVYRAKDSKLHREVAIKLLPEAFAADAERLARFRREAQVLAALNHPHIAGIYGLEDAGGVEALVLELVEGEDLAERIARGPLPLDEALEIARQISEALEAAHEHGIVHRDLKPANVRITPKGIVKVLDFGLAKAVNADAASPEVTHSPTWTGVATAAGWIMGTAAYMSPEQARGKAVDKRTDIWAFGVILYEMLTGRRPFPGDTVSDVVAAILTADPNWSKLPPATPTGVRRLLRLCLEKDPAKRLHDVGDAWLISGDAPAAAAAGTRPRFGWLAIAAIAIAAAGIAVLATRSLRDRPVTQPARKFESAIDRLDPATAPSISPDGRKILYVAGGSLWVRELDRGGAREIVHESAPQFPMWSPDGAHIAYVAKAKLWKVAVSGGTPSAIAPASFREFSSHAGGVWTEDGRIIFAPAATGYGLLAVSADGGDLRPILERDKKEDDIHKPSLLPGGRGILFIADRTIGGPFAMEVLSGNTRKAILEHKGDLLDCPVYSPTGHILYFRKTTSTEGIWAVPFSLEKLETTGQPFLVARDTYWPSVSSDGLLVFARPVFSQQQLVIADANAQVQRSLGAPAEFRRVNGPRFSPDGRRIAFSAEDPNEGSNIYIRDLDTDRLTRLTIGLAARASPTWSPSGDRVIWRTIAAGSTETVLVQRASDATGPERPLVSDASNPDVSPDGKALLFTRYQPNTGGDLFLLPMVERPSGVEKPRAFLETPLNQVFPRFSPDGRLVAYVADDADVYNVYIRRFPVGEERWQASFEGGFRPIWSRSGDRLFYEHENELFEVTVSSTPSLRLGAPRRLFSGKESGLLIEDHGFDVSSTGGFAVVRAIKGERSSTLTVVENWLSDFRDKSKK